VRFRIISVGIIGITKNHPVSARHGRKA